MSLLVIVIYVYPEWYSGSRQAGLGSRIEKRAMQLVFWNFPDNYWTGDILQWFSYIILKWKVRYYKEPFISVKSSVRVAT